MKQKSLIPALVFISSLFFLIQICYGQLTLASLSGTVTDPSQSAISNCRIEVRNDSTGEVRSTTTDGSGAFTLSGMSAGTYTLKVSATGFRELEQHGLILYVGRAIAVNPTLEIAASKTDVQVVESAEKAVVTTEARLSDTLAKNEVSTLPLPGRDVYLLPKLSAGATNIPGAASSTKLN